MQKFFYHAHALFLTTTTLKFFDWVVFVEEVKRTCFFRFIALYILVKIFVCVTPSSVAL